MLTGCLFLKPKFLIHTMVIDDNKEEKLPVIADYNLGKTAPSKMSKKERVWVLVLLMHI